MSSFLMKLTYMGCISVVRRAAHPFPTRRTSTRRAPNVAFLPRNLAAFLCRLSSIFGAVALGGFSLVHESSVFFLPFFVTPKHP